VSERTPKNDLQRLPFSFESGGKTLTTAIVSYEINEMLGTKMRALFQRKKRRDLFDLYWALTVPTAMPVRPKDMIAAFQHYMRDEKTVVPRSEFLAHLNECVREKVGFSGQTSLRFFGPASFTTFRRPLRSSRRNC